MRDQIEAKFVAIPPASEGVTGARCRVFSGGGDSEGVEQRNLLEAA